MGCSGLLRQVLNSSFAVKGDNKLPPVGNTVDVANATWANTIGTTELITVWEDPDFDADDYAGAGIYITNLVYPGKMIKSY